MAKQSRVDYNYFELEDAVEAMVEEFLKKIEQENDDKKRELLTDFLSYVYLKRHAKIGFFIVHLDEQM